MTLIDTEKAKEVIAAVALGWRERDWPEGFHRPTAELVAQDMALQVRSLDLSAHAVKVPKLDSESVEMLRRISLLNIGPHYQLAAERAAARLVVLSTQNESLSAQAARLNQTVIALTGKLAESEEQVAEKDKRIAELGEEGFWGRSA